MTWTTICPLLTCRLTAENVSDYLFLRGILSWGHITANRGLLRFFCFFSCLKFVWFGFSKGLRIEDVVCCCKTP